MDQSTQAIRAAIGGRGDYLLYIYRAMTQAGIANAKEILGQAIAEWGAARARKAPNATPAEFVTRLEHGNPPEIYMRKTLQKEDGLGLVEMRYCPLLAAWQAAGATGRELVDLCDIACEGDYAVVGEKLRLTFDTRLADGAERCLMRVIPRL